MLTLSPPPTAHSRVTQIYIPHIATVIHEQNTLLAKGAGTRGAPHLALESMMVSNPMSVRPPLPLLPPCTDTAQDFLSHNRWALQQRCVYTVFYNASTCTQAYAELPACLEAVQLAYESGERAARVHALDLCEGSQVPVPGRSYENVEFRVRAPPSAPSATTDARRSATAR